MGTLVNLGLDPMQQKTKKCCLMDEHMLKRPETVYVHILKGNKFMKLQGETNKYLEEDIGLNGVVRKSRMHKPAIDT